MSYLEDFRVKTTVAVDVFTKQSMESFKKKKK